MAVALPVSVGSELQDTKALAVELSFTKPMREKATTKWVRKIIFVVLKRLGLVILALCYFKYAHFIPRQIR